MIQHFDWVAREVHIRHQEALREAEKRRLIRTARMNRPTRLSRSGYRLLCRFGQLLVTWRQRLQGYGQAQAILADDGRRP